MSLKRLDLLFREVKDPVAQENFWRIRDLFKEISTGTTGPAGPTGPQGPAGPSGLPTFTFTSDAGTLATNLVRINAANTVTKITDNSSATIPNGIFGICYAKPSATQAEVMVLGVVPGYVGLTVGAAVFISTLGVPTHTPPSSGMVQQIGFALSTTEIFVNLLQPMRRS